MNWSIVTNNGLGQHFVLLGSAGMTNFVKVIQRPRVFATSTYPVFMRTSQEHSRFASADVRILLHHRHSGGAMDATTWL